MFKKLFSNTTASTTAVGSTSKEDWHAPLNKVTSLSKIVAAVVVIILPFLGFFLGVQYASSGELPFVGIDSIDY
jgi:uncharacterized membrane protein YjjP (DUF1212 family)